MPPGFRFQTLLDYKNRIVEECQLALAQRQQRLQQLQARHVQLQTERQTIAQQLQASLQGALAVVEVQHRYRYLASLDRRIDAQIDQIHQAQGAVDEARQALEFALKECKTLEKLREYDQDMWQTQLRHKESRILDDLNIARYRRRVD